jgi:sigma-B regulation protein RsbU (phosphoserine phosphatase)
MPNASSTPTLELLKDDQPQRLIDLDRDSLLIGRRPECDLVLEGGSVSQRHALLTRRGEDAYYVEDLNSRNRTWLNNVPLTGADGPRRLTDGDVIKIVNYDLVFRDHIVRVKRPDESASTILGRIDAVGSGNSSLLEVRPQEKFEAIMELSRALGGAVGLDEALGGALEILLKAFPQAGRASVLLREERRGDLVPKAIRSRAGIERAVEFDPTVLAQVLGRGQAILSEESDVHKPGAMTMSVPLRDEALRPVGILQVDAGRDEKRFANDDLDFLAALAAQVSVAVSRARLQEILLRQTEYDQELRFAREVQQALLPSRRPRVADYLFWDYYEPAQLVGGDYFDYIPGTAPPGGAARAWCLAVGDVVGKGMAAALLMARLSSGVRLLLHTEAGPERVVARLNHEFATANLGDRFITLVLAWLDVSSHRLRVVNAGHYCPLIRKADGRVEEILPRSPALPLGVVSDYAYEAVSVPIAPGDVVVLYTDGVIDARDTRNRDFRLEGLLGALRDAGPGVADVGETILHHIGRHTTGQAQFDDITLLCFGRVDGSTAPA